MSRLLFRFGRPDSLIGAELALDAFLDGPEKIVVGRPLGRIRVEDAMLMHGIGEGDLESETFGKIIDDLVAEGAFEFRRHGFLLA